MATAITFNDAQRDVLGILSCINNEEDLKALKIMLLQFLNERLQREMDDLWDKGVVNEEKMESWKTSHHRTPYK